MENSKLSIFENEQFGQIRAMLRDGEPLFVAVDVCKALEIDPTATRRLDDDEKNTLRLTQSTSGNPNVTVITEPGLYTLILGSRKPEAKAFKRWVTHEIIPSIRKTGGYISGQETMSDADLMARALLVAQRQIDERNRTIERMKPKEIFADAVSASHTSILMGDMAKILKQNGVDIGQKRFYEWLREKGFLVKQAGISWNTPTQRGMDSGFFEIKEYVFVNGDKTFITKTTRITGKGQQHFVKMFLGGRV